MKILMTDDDSDDRLLAQLAFKKLNAAHSIDFVVDGQELIDYLNQRVESKAELPDLILLDLKMPRKNGREALREIKANPQVSNIDIIIFSTASSDKDRKSLMDLGAKEYIVKPVHQREMVDVFRKICDELEAKPGWHYFIQPSLGHS